MALFIKEVSLKINLKVMEFGFLKTETNKRVNLNRCEVNLQKMEKAMPWLVS